MFHLKTVALVDQLKDATDIKAAKLICLSKLTDTIFAQYKSSPESRHSSFNIDFIQRSLSSNIDKYITADWSLDFQEFKDFLNNNPSQFNLNGEEALSTFALHVMANYHSTIGYMRGKIKMEFDVIYQLLERVSQNATEKEAIRTIVEISGTSLTKTDLVILVDYYKACKDMNKAIAEYVRKNQRLPSSKDRNFILSVKINHPMVEWDALVDMVQSYHAKIQLSRKIPKISDLLKLLNADVGMDNNKLIRMAELFPPNQSITEFHKLANAAFIAIKDNPDENSNEINSIKFYIEALKGTYADKLLYVWKTIVKPSNN